MVGEFSCNGVQVAEEVVVMPGASFVSASGLLIHTALLDRKIKQTGQTQSCNLIFAIRSLQVRRKDRLLRLAKENTAGKMKRKKKYFLCLIQHLSLQVELVVLRGGGVKM